jgi:hypothetical protein
MTIYVDSLIKWAITKNWPYKAGSCHLFTDSKDLDELHDFADRLGLKRSWFQSRKIVPHYDLTKNKRLQALRLGAKEGDVKLREIMLEKINRRRLNAGL